MTSKELKSKVMTLGNKLAPRMGGDRKAAFVEAWAIVKAGGLEVAVRGVSFGNRQEALKRLAAYAPEQVKAVLVPEPENPADPAAAAVMAGVQGGRGLFRLGYVPRTLAPVMAVLRGRLCQKSRRQGILKRKENAGMEFISGENREQILMLPDCIGDYITDNNSVRVIEAYINSLDMAALGCIRPEPNTTGRPMYDPKRYHAGRPALPRPSEKAPKERTAAPVTVLLRTDQMYLQGAAYRF
jgi:hypothetical protein